MSRFQLGNDQATQVPLTTWPWTHQRNNPPRESWQEYPALLGHFMLHFMFFIKKPSSTNRNKEIIFLDANTLQLSKNDFLRNFPNVRKVRGYLTIENSNPGDHDFLWMLTHSFHFRSNHPVLSAECCSANVLQDLLTLSTLQLHFVWVIPQDKFEILNKRSYLVDVTLWTLWNNKISHSGQEEQ